MSMSWGYLRDQTWLCVYCWCQTSEGVVSPRGEITRGSLTPTIHTQSCLIPIITWCHHFFHSNQYSAHSKQFKVSIESNRRLRCQVTTLSRWQISESPPPPVGKMRALVFAGDWACEIKLHQTGVICSRGDNEVDHAVCLKAEFQMHTALSNANGKFYTTMLYPCFSRSVCFSMGSPAWWRFGLCSSGSSLVSDDVTLRSCTREFQGRQMRFWWMLSTMSWK